MADTTLRSETDVVLIGAGIMSATLGVMLKELNPNITIAIFERLEHAAAESSDAWNNAGTGHSAFCELNYTPEREDGSIETKKAVKIAESFEISRQFWSYLVEQGRVALPENFIRSIPHMSFVWGEKNVTFLKKRYEALQHEHLFRKMQFSDKPEKIAEWIPLVMEGRDKSEVNAATYMPIGTDVNFGALTRSMFKHLQEQDGVTLHFNHEVKRLSQNDNGSWKVVVKDLEARKRIKIKTPFVFIGAGGGSLRLMEKADIPEGDGYGGFPVSGQWLKCTNKDIIDKHFAKVYGLASVGAPPMSVPHIDSRLINGEKALLFGPYAGFSTKFLKNGSYLDLPASIQLNNVIPMLSAAFHNLPLTKYLIEQVSQSDDERIATLREYFPNADPADWELQIAGQRVQVIKKGPDGGGVLEFGTEVVTKADGSLAVLLGASPGASTSASIMLELIRKCFPQSKSAEWQTKLTEMIPSYGQTLNDNPELSDKIRAQTAATLNLTN